MEKNIVDCMSDRRLRTSCTPNISGGEYLVDVAGYIDKATQVEVLQTSGKALEEYRKKAYPNYVPADADIDGTNPFDPTAQIGYDFFDYHRDVAIAQNASRSVQRYLEEVEREEVAARLLQRGGKSDEPYPTGTDVNGNAVTSPA